MVFAHSLMILILIISFGLLAAVVMFWLGAGKLVQDDRKETTAFLDTARWDVTTLLMR